MGSGILGLQNQTKWWGIKAARQTSSAGWRITPTLADRLACGMFGNKRGITNAA
jgi:hypothetical protein